MKTGGGTLRSICVGTEFLEFWIRCRCKIIIGAFRHYILNEELLSPRLKLVELERKQTYCRKQREALQSQGGADKNLPELVDI